MREALALQLYEIGAVKMGEFTLKSGIVSPIYIDFRSLVSYPRLLRDVADAMWEEVKGLSFETLCGVPYSALPMAIALSLGYDIPLCMRRKEAKSYGTKKMIEGVFTPGDRTLIIEDVITTGASVIETAHSLEEAGLKPTTILTLLDREQGGKEALEKQGFKVKTIFTLSELLSYLQEAGKVEQPLIEKVRDFISHHRVSV